MKRCQSLLICGLALFSASADSSDTLPLPRHAAVDVSAQTALSADRLPNPQTTQATFAGVGGDVLKDMRATSVLVQNQVARTGTPNRWLIALAAFGLVVLQLRRKHRSLPQRRIASYGR